MKHPITKEQIAKYRQHLKEHGYLYIENIDDDFDHLQFVQEFGKLMPQYDGEMVWSIKADPKFDDAYHSLNTKKLSPHTECYEFQSTPPKYLSLWCQEVSDCGGGQTTLYDLFPYFKQLDEERYNAATSVELEFQSSSGIQSSDLGRTAKHPLLIESEGEIMVRFSRNCMDCKGNTVIDELADDVVKEFEENHVKIDWSKNSFLIWDNHRILHSRTAYTDRKRELTRVWLEDWVSKYE